MQVAKEKERVKRAMLLPVMSYLLLLCLYRKSLDPGQGFIIFQFKRRLCDQVRQERIDRSEVSFLRNGSQSLVA
jgi:hypothetical protein